MADFAEMYAKQNRILDIYLKNAGIGTVVMEVNHQVIGRHICEYLHTNYHLHLIDYGLLTGGIVNLLKQVGQSTVVNNRRICIYNFPTDSGTIDVIQSLNLSRELLRRVDRVVFVMPTLLVEQIRTREPNLRDYIGLFLDYNRKSVIPFEPVFDVPFKKRLTRNEQVNLKNPLIDFNEKENLQQYFRYVNQFYHQRLPKHECYQKLLPAFEQLLEAIHDRYCGNVSDCIQATEELLYQTASVLAVQGYYDLAQERFEMMLQIECGKIAEKNMHTLHGLEGISYCLYCMGNYNRSEEVLLQAIQILQSKETNFVAWICRLYSNYAACCIRLKEYLKAQEVLNRSFHMLLESKQLKPEREARIRTNLMICQLQQGEIAEISKSGWQQYMNKVKSEPEIERLGYANCILMDAWYKGVFLGANREALTEATAALDINRELLEENAYELAVTYAVLEKIYSQLGDTKNEGLARKKKRNILSASRSMD